jgi:excisionase family DNA binding protein
MQSNQITFDNLPQAISQLLSKVEGIERRLAAASALPPQQPDYVTLKEAQIILRHTVTVGTIYNWKHQGRISSNKVGRKLLFKRIDVENMLKGNYTPTAAEQQDTIEQEANAILRQSVKSKKR